MAGKYFWKDSKDVAGAVSPSTAVMHNPVRLANRRAFVYIQASRLLPFHWSALL